MATNVPPSETPALDAGPNLKAMDMMGVPLASLLKPLASLKLTVVLFALAIFIVLAGTLAQVEKDIWEVIDLYFRTSIAWIDLQIFFPRSFFPNMGPIPGGFYFPGGWLIGGVMALNLLAAHSLRFKIQASGVRLKIGLVLILLGMVITYLVIASGSNPEGLQEAKWIEWSTLWILFKALLVSSFAGTIYAFTNLQAGQKIEKWILGISTVLLGSLLLWIFYQGDSARLGDSSMRILWQLTKGTLAGIVLLIGCLLIFKKRAGIVLLHGGIGLMMFSELLVGTTAIEGQMQIAEGQTVDFVQDIRQLELTIIDTSAQDHDQIVVIPESRLLAGGTIQHELLPFDIEVVKFYRNSQLRRLAEGDNNLATVGAGLQWIVEEARPVSGTDSGGMIDMSSAYIKFMQKDSSKVLGTHLLGQFLSFQNFSEEISVDGKSYDTFLQFKRTYKPYSMNLIDVRKDDYIGTSTPRNYSSDVQLVDKSRNVDRKIKIWMNNPLRFAGETFYQSGYGKDPNTGIETTTLQVVTNTGWMIPYVSCMIVATGLLTHFGGVLLRFLNRRAKAEASVEVATEKLSRGAARRQGGTPKQTSTNDVFAKVLPVLIVLIMAAWIAGKMRLPTTPPKQMDLYAFGKLPVVYQGRTKPIDTLARNSLRIISDKQTFTDANEKKQPAIKWLLDVIAKTPTGMQHQVVRIENLEIQELLGLKRRKRYRYAVNEFSMKLGELSRQAEQARQKDPGDVSLFEKKILELEQKIGTLDLLIQAFSPPQIRPDHAREDILESISRQQALAQRHPPLMIPPHTEEDQWETYSVAWTKDLVQASLEQKNLNPATESMSSILDAYARDDAAAFNRHVKEYSRLLEKSDSIDIAFAKIGFESFFNHFQPFYYSAVLYVFSFLLAALSWLGWTRPLNRSSFWLILFILVVHTFALVSRIYISGRPPVTNLYSSAVFIGWGCVILGMVLEAIYRLGIGNIISSVAGFVTLLIAHFLAGDGDTFVVLQAVLDTQFWLATHVTCITLGYSTTFMAGLLGTLYILFGVLTPSLSLRVGKDLNRMIYGTICFAIFFSFVGTVLGGLWADDSWGRFWGWDPKENGALIIVLWNALVLHARWGGMAKERGLAALAVAGNIVTSWSWFGVNELGVGLHSYGFTEGILRTLGIVVGVHLAIIALGMLPLSMWWSRRNQASTESETSPR